MPEYLWQRSEEASFAVKETKMLVGISNTHIFQFTLCCNYFHVSPNAKTKLNTFLLWQSAEPV